MQKVQSQVLQQTLKRLEQAFVSMWEQSHGFPRFKKAGTMRSFVFPQLGKDALKNTSQICPQCNTVTGKKDLSERIHHCHYCGYKTARDVAAAQVVCLRGLAAVGHTVKMLSEGKAVALPTKKESSPL